MLPTQQRLEGLHLAGREIDDGLIIQSQLARGDSVPQLAGQGAPLGGAGFQGSGVKADSTARLAPTASAFALGEIHRGIGTAHKAVDAFDLLRDGDADAHADLDVMAIQHVGATHRRHELVRQLLASFGHG